MHSKRKLLLMLQRKVMATMSQQDTARLGKNLFPLGAEFAGHD